MPAKIEKRKVPPLEIRKANLVYKNLSGRRGKYNAEGLRNFHVVLDTATADMLRADGWNIKTHQPKKEGDVEWYSLKVWVRFDNYPPRMIMVVGGKKINLNEVSVGLLDTATIEKADLIISASQYNVNGNSGIKAYLSKGFFTLSPGDLELEYFGLPEDEDIDSRD